MLNFERLGPPGTAKPGDFATPEAGSTNAGCRCLILREYDAEYFEVEILSSWVDIVDGTKEPPQSALGRKMSLRPFLPPADDTLEQTREMVEMGEGAV